MRYRTGRTTTTAPPESANFPNWEIGGSAPAAADPYSGWNAWLQASIAAAIAEERKL
jgi:hypothetical protein